jgi:adenine-specific DNA methylase
MTGKSFIEADFPIKEVSEEAASEKNIRHGHISTLHIWWARKPLASSRASTYAALTPGPRDEEERLKRRIRQLPGSLLEAIQLTEKSELVRKALGDQLFEAFIRNKKIEWDTYRIQVTGYELQRYLPVL